jgi:hypothetical protein
LLAEDNVVNSLFTQEVAKQANATCHAAESLRTLAAGIEAAGKTGDLADATPLAERLQAEARRCIRFLPKLRGKMSRARGPAD